MKFWTKIKLNDGKDAEHLLRSFFKDFNPENSIVIRGMEAEVEIHFTDNPPLEIINTISHRDILEFSFGKPLEKDEQKKPAEQCEAILENEKNKTKIRVRMKCMPEILPLELALGSIDKTQSVEERVEYILVAMGWKELNENEQQIIFEIASKAVKLDEINFDNIFILSNIKIYKQSSMEPRMLISKFINDFVIKYYPTQRVKLLDFLKELQEIVAKENEMMSITDVIS